MYFIFICACIYACPSVFIHACTCVNRCIDDVFTHQQKPAPRRRKESVQDMDDDMCTALALSASMACID